MKTYVISLGGSIIVPDKVNVSFLRRFRKLVLDFVRKGNRLVIVCGGGRTSRNYSEAAKKIARVGNDDLDWIGIKATMINAELVRLMFGKLAHDRIVNEPHKKVKTNKKIIIGSGWKPGWSSDYDAVLLAKQFKAKRVINLSNISYAYTKDPRRYKDAKKIKEITWRDFQKIVGTRWVANASFPFDPEASKKAKQFKLEVIIAKGTDLNNLKNILNDKRFKGTIIR